MIKMGTIKFISVLFEVDSKSIHLRLNHVSLMTMIYPIDLNYVGVVLSDNTSRGTDRHHRVMSLPIYIIICMILHPCKYCIWLKKFWSEFIHCSTSEKYHTLFLNTKIKVIIKISTNQVIEQQNFFC